MGCTARPLFLLWRDSRYRPLAPEEVWPEWGDSLRLTQSSKPLTAEATSFQEGRTGEISVPHMFYQLLLLEDSTFWLIYCLCWFFLTLISAFTRINFFCLLSPYFVVHFLTFWARCLIHMVFSFMFIFVSIFKVRYFPLCMTLEVFCSFWYNFMIFLFLSRKSAISVYISF